MISQFCQVKWLTLFFIWCILLFVLIMRRSARILPAGFSYFLKKSYQFIDRLEGLENYSPHQLELLSFLRKAANQQEVDGIVQSISWNPDTVLILIF